MTKYWVIAPCDSTKPEVFDKVWGYDRRNETIAIGWHELGDVSKMSQSQLRARYKEVFGDTRMLARDCNTLWRFHHEISPGDVVVARRGTKKVVGIGTVKGPAFYDEKRGSERVAHPTEYSYPNFIPVNWEAKEIGFDNIRFSRYTMYEIPEERYRELIGPAPPEGPGEEFVLEKHLEDFLVANFGTIFKGEFELYVDPEGNKGQQYPTVGENGKEIGYIDILARERGTGSFVVIELKKGRESDTVVGQILRYMGWVKENLCEQGQDVRGLVICKDEDERLRYALKALPGNVGVKFYRVSFRLSDRPNTGDGQ
jgi:restriction system protein